MPERWICPSCKQGVTLYVKCSEPPRCKNKHLKNGYEMVLQADSLDLILSNGKKV